MIVNNAQRIMLLSDGYIGSYCDLYVTHDTEYNTEDVIEIEKYIEETFIPSVNEIMDQIINLCNVTLVMGSCVIRSETFGPFFVVNDTFMEDYIYRFFWIQEQN